MVSEATTNIYLRTVIGLGDNPEGTERARAIQEEGLLNLKDIWELAEDEGIKTLCTSVWKPAGTIPQSKQCSSASGCEDREGDYSHLRTETHTCGIWGGHL